MFDVEKCKKRIFKNYKIFDGIYRQVLEYFLGENFRLDISEITPKNLLNILDNPNEISVITPEGKKATIYKTCNFDFSIFELNQNGYTEYMRVHMLDYGKIVLEIQILEYEADESMFFYTVRQDYYFSDVTIDVKYYNTDTMKIIDAYRDIYSVETYKDLENIFISPDGTFSKCYEYGEEEDEDEDEEDENEYEDEEDEVGELLNMLQEAKESAKTSIMTRRMVEERQ